MTTALGRSGLSAEEAALRLLRDGPNTLPSPPRVHPLLVFGGQLLHFFAVMVWVAAGLALLGGMPVLALAIAVVSSSMECSPSCRSTGPIGRPSNCGNYYRLG